MASSIPRARRKEYLDSVAALTLKIALFTGITGYDENAATNTYTSLVSGGATEVSDAGGSGYTTGGYTLNSKVVSTVGTTNVVIMTASATTVPSATFSCQYGVIYDDTSKKIYAIEDFGASYSVTNGTLTITFDNTNGVLKIS